MAKKRAAKAPNRATKAAKASKAKASKKSAKKANKAKKAAKPSKGAKASKKGAKAAKKAPAARRAPAPKSAPAAKRAPAAKQAAAKKSPAIAQARKAARARTTAATGRKPNLERERRSIREEEELVPSPPSSLDLDRTASAARTGRHEYEQKLREHTSTGPALTGGDIDADWEDAETVGDEAPGGDNPTPDQDIVDEIGRAVGIEYDDDEELQGGEEVAERDRHRWELDPASKDDFEDE